MKRYKIVYTDDGDSGCPQFSYRVFAHDRDHAIEQFNENGDADDAGWKLVSVTLVR